MAGGSTNGMVLMCTGIEEETKQNELYQMARGMNAMLIRDKVSSTYDPRTTHLIVGTLGKTEKFLCGLAAGIPMVDVSYVKESQQAGSWIQEIEQYDIGREGHHLRMTAAASKLVVEDLPTRIARNRNGGVFKGWRVVVLIENTRQQEIYRRLLELGGARVERWTLQALLDLRDSELSLVTHVVTHPSMLVYDAFRKFLERNDKTARVPVMAYIYVGDFLTKKVTPTVQHFDIRQPAIIDLLASHQIKSQLRPLKMQVPDYLLLPSLSSPSIGISSRHSSRAGAGASSAPVPSASSGAPVPSSSSGAPIPSSSSGAPVTSSDYSEVQDTGPEIWEEDNYPGTEYSMAPLKRTRSEESSKVSSDQSKKRKIASSSGSRSSSVAERKIVQPEPSPRNQVSPGLLRLKEKAQSLIKKKSQTDRRSVQDVITLDEKSSDNTLVQGSQQTQKDQGSQQTQKNQGSQQTQKNQGSQQTQNHQGSQQSQKHQGSQQSQKHQGSQQTQNQTTQKQTTPSNSFLGMARSGLTRKSSARSLAFSRNDSIVSTASQDSFSSEPDSSRAVPLVSLLDGEAGKLQFCHNLMVQRRTKVNRLDVGNCGQPRGPDRMVLHEDQVPLSTSLCANIWTCLETESEQRDLERVLDEGWLAALDMLGKVVNESRFAPCAAMHKVLMEALMSHKDELVRNTAFKTLSHCLDMKPPGPASPQTAQHYLELFSKVRPHIEQWKFDSNEPWSFLQSVIESCLENLDKTFSFPDEIDCELRAPGTVLVLQLITSIIDIDMNNYFDSLITEDSLPSSYKPLLSSILFPQDSPVWGRNLELLCKLYVKTLGQTGTENMLVFVRKILGFSAQLVQLQERAAKNPQSNSSKAEMANYIATHLAMESSDEGCLSPDRLWAELYLLQPTWLSALVSGKCLARNTNITEREEIPSLRSVINMFVDTKIDSQPCLKDIEEVVLTPTKTSTPVVLRLSSQRLNSGGGGKLTPCNPPSTRKVRNVNSKNKFGETPLHIAAKKGQLERMANCLCSPGVDINCRDNNGFTPLHEAVGSNKLEAVRLLLNHSPHSHTLERYFTPTKTSQVSSKKSGYRVDLMAVDTENGMNPVQESVSSDFADITRLILEKVVQEQSRPKSPFPTLNDLMDAETKDGSTMTSLVQSDNMKQLLETFEGENQENVPPSGGLEVVRRDVFGLLLELFLTKYLALHCLPHTYGMFKEVKVDQVMKVGQEQSGISLRLNSRQVKWGPCRVEEGLVMEQFGRRPRFELFRTEEVKSRDFKDFEKLIYFKKSLGNMDPQHPVLPFLTLIKVTNSTVVQKLK